MSASSLRASWLAVFCPAATLPFPARAAAILLDAGAPILAEGYERYQDGRYLQPPVNGVDPSVAFAFRSALFDKRMVTISALHCRIASRPSREKLANSSC
jgi:hypothetical protein